MPAVRVDPQRTHASETNPMRIVVPVCLVVSVLGYAVYQLFGGDLKSQGFLLFAGVVAALVYLLTLVDIRIGIACMFLAIGVSPELEIGGISNIRLEDFIVPVLAVAWITRHMQQREAFVPTPLSRPIIAFLSAALVSTLLGTVNGTIEFKPAFLMLGKTVIYFLMFLIVLNNTRTLAEFKAYTILMVLVTIISTAESFGVQQASGVSMYARLHGPFGETGNIYAGYLAMNLALMIGLFVYLPTSGLRFMIGLMILPVLYALSLTLSRTTYIALTIAVVGFGLLKARRVAFLFLAAVLLIGIVVPDHVIAKVSSIFLIGTERQPESYTARVVSWQESTPRIMAAPFLGYGVSYINFAWVDNEYMRVIFDMGFIGLAAFLWMLGAMGWQAFRSFSVRLNDSVARGYTAGYCMAWIAIVVHASGATSFASIRTMETFMVLTGLLGALVANREAWGIVESKPADGEARPEAVPGLENVFP